MIILINGSMSYECVRPMTNRSDILFMTIKVYHAHIHYSHILKYF